MFELKKEQINLSNKKKKSIMKQRMNERENNYGSIILKKTLFKIRNCINEVYEMNIGTGN